MNKAKQEVHDFWDQASCGEQLYLSGDGQDAYRKQSRIRYELEPYILEFAAFDAAKGQEVLEIGVGLGADHQCFAEQGAHLHGIDLTVRAVEHTRRRLSSLELQSDLRVGDAENLPFDGDTFDLVYSWGVLHHSPDTPQAIREVYRVLKTGGVARIMMYHRWSFVGLMLWIRYALLRLKPFTPLSAIYANYLESPGTKAYSVAEARRLFGQFSQVDIKTVLTHGDLLASQAGQRHGGALLDWARKVWPRRLIKACFPRNGLFMLITATK